MTADDRQSELRLSLFGPVQITVDGAPAPRLRSRKGSWLLALLALRHDREVERDWIMGTLWPDALPENASASLRQSLSDLRRALGSAAGRLQAPTPRSLLLHLRPDETDVLAFDAAIAQGDYASLEAAVGLYSGPLLEGCTEEWAEQEREQREQTMLAALEALAAHDIARGDAPAAVGRLRRAVSLDPYRETAQRGLIEALGRSGDYAAAIMVYRDLRLMLRREIGAEPDPSTSAVYERVRAEARERREGRVAQSSAGNSGMCRLPRPFTSFIGRQPLIDEVGSLLAGNRLVTLIGPGGVGKTRLAIGAVETIADRYPDGACFVDLSPLSEPDMLDAWVAAAIGTPEAVGQSVLRRLTERLRERDVLLVLDNCEHVIEAAARFCAHALGECARLRILATSRQPLGVTGESVLRVPPLSMPPETTLRRHVVGPGSAAASEALQYDSVRLFADRARLAQTGFALSDDNAAVVAEICRRLDGLPLGIELAAGRARSMSLGEIANRLGAHFGLLMNGTRAAPERHHSIQSAIDWSHDLLTERERVLFRRASVFAGGWSLQAAEAICSDDAVLPEEDVANVLTELVDKSLVAYDPLDRCDRYYLLETVRQYARERLEQHGEDTDYRARHAAYFAGVLSPNPDEEHRPCWCERLTREHDNYRAALDWLVQTGDAETALAMVGRLLLYWGSHGHRSEGRVRARAVLEMPGADAPTAERATVLVGASSLAWAQGDSAEALRYAEEALAIARSLNDATRIGAALASIASAALAIGDLDRARSCYDDSLAAARMLGHDMRMCHCLLGLGELERHSGDFAAAQRMYEQARELAETMGDGIVVALCTGNLGSMAFQSGDYVQATSLMQESLRGLAVDGGEWLIPLMVPTWAGLEIARGRTERAAVLLGAADAGRERTSTAIQRADIDIYDRCVRAVRSAGDPSVIERAWARGRAMSSREAVEYALEARVAVAA